MGQVRQYASDAQRQAAYRKRAKEAQRAQMKERGLPAMPVIPTMPGTARWRIAVQSAGAILDTTIEEMQSYHEERSQRWQESDRGELFQEKLERIGELLAELEEVEI